MNRFQVSVILLAALGVFSCKPISDRKQPPPSLEQLASEDLDLNGEQLANAYCGSCHLKPEPELLPTFIWTEKVLPDMRKRMGLYLPEDFGQPLPEDLGVPQGVYSDIQLIRQENWEKILAYYQENSPTEIPAQAEKKLPQLGVPGFKVSRPEFPSVKGDLTTMLRVKPGTGELWLGDRMKALYILDAQNGFRIRDSIPTDVSPVDIHWYEDGSFDLLTMGRMDPAPDTSGMVSKFSSVEGAWIPDTVLSKLIRPVDMDLADWNADDVPDYTIAEFGDHFGKMSLYISGREESILRKQPGARRSIALDFDHDGDLDVLGMMAQAQEGIYVWLNQGEGDFREKSLLRFHPAFGASDFRFEDMDGDGHRDIVVVNGDNADLSQVLKSYHGVYVFLNDGDNEFEQSYFYPMYGASGLEIADFDGDGRLDMFVLSFFPDSKQEPRQDLLYFRQNPSGGFDPFSVKEDLKGHWLTMTSGDVDLDGDVDVFVGAFEFDDLYKGAQDNWKPFVFLENQFR
ncbi:VCBS repeat-containing protein [Algoriphagus halophytocola]|uniref:FG-GAP repeat domain-containing protein n=1 Tax=Algoriphagus halophytocola TaxID=2991499 RepID=UPI0022DDC171|nr:VCBS repeat-containing protein [Algoriphagus sp. TR-M9]WBL43675.1 VCBS repeat-containing protein [Algoriphagus sp. TR-M9]